MAFYNPANDDDISSARVRLELLIEKKVRFELKEIREKRTSSQNSLYWLWLNCLSSETGNDKVDLHDEFRRRFLGVDLVTVLCVERERLRSTKELDSKQMKYYLDRIQEFSASELGIILPDPESQYYEQFYNEYNGFI